MKQQQQKLNFQTKFFLLLSAIRGDFHMEVLKKTYKFYAVSVRR